jgi:long-chain-fatty-acid--CoA ligase ACSBG
MPKGVMLSHDNYVWTKKSLSDFYKRDPNELLTIVSYLPLSHVASQFADIVGSLIEGIHIYFAEPTALQGTLIQTLQEVRPTLFFSVPRVWEKIYDKMMEVAKSNGFIKSKIGISLLMQHNGQRVSALMEQSNR